MSESNPLRKLPSVEQLLVSGVFDREIELLARPLVVAVIREVLQSIRDNEGEIPPSEGSAIVDLVRRRCESLRRRRITRVINGSGVLIHTNLGRAPIGRELLSRISDGQAGYSTLEFDLATGKRGRRGSFLSFLLAELTGAEAALAVNNNAAALFLILNTFANKREVVVSRSELVQIGGGFRIPDIIRRAGARLVEVGTTNQTNLDDYAGAIGPKTALILKVHQSNFAISGFVAESSAGELAELARAKGVLSVYDLGSGALLQTESFGMAAEPTVRTALKSSSQLVCFSGDKLMGGTQAGIILGASTHIEELHSNPVYRAFRLDKLTLALLEEIALTYLRGEETMLLPLWRCIATSLDDLQARAAAIAAGVDRDRLGVKIEASVATPGGGALPGGSLESVAISLQPKLKPTRLQKMLLDANPPLIGHIEEERLLLDLRTIDPAEDGEVIAILNSISSCIP